MIIYRNVNLLVLPRIIFLLCCYFNINKLKIDVHDLGKKKKQFLTLGLV